MQNARLSPDLLHQDLHFHVKFKSEKVWVPVSLSYLVSLSYVVQFFRLYSSPLP